MVDCPCPHHPHNCYGHPHECGCADETKPLIEFGTGWAKIHYRRELTDEDRAALTHLFNNQKPKKS